MTTRVCTELFFASVLANHLRKLSIPEGQDGTFVFRLFGPTPSIWTVDLKSRRVAKGGVPLPDLYLEMDDADFVALTEGCLNAVEAVANGRVRFEGNPALLHNLGAMLSAKAD